MSWSKEVHEFSRFEEILRVLFEEGFDVLLEEAELLSHLSLSQRMHARNKKKHRLTHEERLRNTLERLGPTFIKLGQMLSVRPDLLPRSYIKELEKLQDQVKPLPYAKIKEHVEHELGKPLTKVFSSFDRKPLASASISQVHKAVLKDGKKVAVKVQRPGTRSMMEADTDIMRYCARLLEKHRPAVKRYNPLGVVEEFASWTAKELDFRREAQNAIRFAHNFQGSKTVRIPEVREELSTRELLVMEYLDGLELHDPKALSGTGIDLTQVIRNGIGAVFTQVFEHGLFHADPHPGNILVLKGNRIAFIDFGIVGFFDDDLKRQSVCLLQGLVMQDLDLIMDTLEEMGLDPGTDKAALRQEIAELIAPLQHATIKETKLSIVMERMLDAALRHKVAVPAQFVLLGKTLVTLEGVALEYDPDFNLVEESRPFIQRLMLERYSPKEQVKALLKTGRRYKRFLDLLPGKVDGALETFRKGTIKVDISDTDINKLSREIDKSSNRIAYGLIIAALLISSAFLMQVQQEPLLYGIPLIAFALFLVASLLGIALIVSILKERI